MSKPTRVQLRRVKGWRMPPNTVKVDRTTKFGNPFRALEKRSAADCVFAFHRWLTDSRCDSGIPEAKQMLLESLHELRGKNLACWCRPGTPCHADVLLRLANKTVIDETLEE